MFNARFVDVEIFVIKCRYTNLINFVMGALEDDAQEVIVKAK